MLTNLWKMPKPGQKKSSWRSQYVEHDFRSVEPQRRVSFKSRGGMHRDNKKDWSNSLKAHLEDEDVDMGSTQSVSRYNTKRYMKGGKRGNRGSPIPQRNMKRKLIEGPISWYRIFLPYGNKYEKEFIQKILIDNLSPMPFIPIMWSTNGNAVTFYIDDFKTAEKLNNLDREIQLPDGFKLIIKVTSGTPVVDVNVKLKDRMKEAMKERYNPQTKALDLTRFHIHPNLQDIFCALSKNIICVAALDIISENIPELEALNLNNNSIQMLIHMRDIGVKLPNLKILHIGHNKLKEIAQLTHLKGVPITELYLEGNPLCNRYKDPTTYLSEVRKRLPKVIKLDGVDYPPPISFDISEEVKVPTSKQTYLCHPDGQAIVRQFLEQYMLILDSDSRQPLLQAYHEQAVFSMTMAYPYGQNHKNSSILNWYNMDNRNLQRVVDSERRLKLLKQGNLQIVTFLQEMPATKHDIHSFTVDLSLFTPQMMLVNVGGIFKEMKSSHKNPPLRHFFRTFVIVPAGSGFCIVNEELHITNATDEQIKMAFKTPIPEVIITPDTATIAPVPDDNVKQQMIQVMSEQSGMNIDWSRKCLEGMNWDFNAAAQVFTDANSKGTIPPEAFVK